MNVLMIILIHRYSSLVVMFYYSTPSGWYLPFYLSPHFAEGMPMAPTGEENLMLVRNLTIFLISSRFKGENIIFYMPIWHTLFIYCIGIYSLHERDCDCSLCERVTLASKCPFSCKICYETVHFSHEGIKRINY